MAEEDILVGPLPPKNNGVLGAVPKRRKYLEHEALFLENIPNKDLYEKSYMHRDLISFAHVTSTGYLITASDDGHVKFWKTTTNGIEFLKHFRAHSAAITGLVTNYHGDLLATVSRSAKDIKIFDVFNYDMINMISLDFVPGSICFVFPEDQSQQKIAISDYNSGTIKLMDARTSSKILDVVDIHKNPVVAMKYNNRYEMVVSMDNSGMIEYWSPKPPFDVIRDAVVWKFKSETDLYAYKKSGSCPSCLVFSPDFENFITYGLKDRQIRVWKFSTAKIFRVYDESLLVVSEMQQAGNSLHRLDDMEFGRRLAIERELDANQLQAKQANIIFDESGNFIIYATLIGIKVVNLKTNRVGSLIGQSESHRFLNLSLYQGASKKKKVLTIDMATAENQALLETEAVDQILFCTAWKKNRFYLFSRRGPDRDDSVGRDVFNEKPTKEEKAVATMNTGNWTSLSHRATLHTTYGDIFLKLYPEATPKAVENFVTHARSNYYNGHIIHRVIKGFMIQTGDPRGDGTGGESIWGEEFKDEIVPDLTHDRAGTLSMANAGPNSNGSQFFITTVPTPWLDKKHTIFGCIISGMDVVQKIENVAVDKSDKPLVPIRITSITLSKGGASVE